MSIPNTLVSAAYRPSSPITGEEASIIYRGQNVLLSGKIESPFFRAYAGSYNIGETYTGVAITGTITFTASSTTITGTTTAFLDELHLGQLIVAANGEPLVVERLVTQTSFICARLPTTAQTGVAAARVPRLESMDIYRTSLLWGNPVITDNGNILVVGSGIFYKNGTVLPGSSLTATRTVQLAKYASSTLNYSIKTIGFSVTPVTVTGDITVVASGGTKNTQPGYYSFQVGYYSSVTEGYSNAGATLLEGGTAGYHVTVANSTFNFDFTSDVTNRPANSTGYVIYASAYTNSSDQSFINSTQGPWFEVIRIPYASLSGADAYAFDYVDANLGNLVSGDNTAPANADWIASLAGYACLVSCGGQGVNSTGRVTSTSPGPFIFPMKGNNIEAYPASFAVPTEKGENIIGQVSANGRLYLLTANTLQVATPTGLDAAPFTVRPFWKVGFANPKNLVFVNDTLYGFTSKGMYRSIATGNEAEATNDFASSVNAQMAEWQAGYVYVDSDPKNRCICVFHTGAQKNTDGYWETTVYIYSLDIYDWLPPVILTDSTRDMIVTGTAVVNNSLYFIAGGRRSGTTDRYDTFAWDDPRSLQSVPWYIAWNYMSSGSEFIAKTIRKLRLRASIKSGTVKVYTAQPNSDVDVTDLENGTNAASSDSVPTSTTTKTYGIINTRIRNGLMWTVRINGTSQSTDSKFTTVDSFQELAYEYDIAGQKR